MAERSVSFRKIGSVLLEDTEGMIKDSKRWPLLVDTAGRAATFFKYRDVNYLNAVDPDDMDPEKIRRLLLGSLRYGKSLVIDMMEADMLDTLSKTFDQIVPGLMSWILDKSIMKEDKFIKLVRQSDGPDYQENRIAEFYSDQFKFFLITQMETPPGGLLAVLDPVTIE